MLRAILLRGIPGCGKSTWAKDFINQNPGWTRVNRDDIRGKLFGEDYKHSSGAEKKVLSERNRQIEYALANNLNIIVDETFCNANTCKQMEDFLIAHKVSFEYKDFSDVSVEECIRRDNLRTGRAHVGKMVIYRMAKNLKEMIINQSQNKVAEPTKGLPYCILVDMDGTLSLITNRNPFDTAKTIHDRPNIAVTSILYAMQKTMNPDIGGTPMTFIVTGREEKYRDVTVQWLKKNNVTYDHLYMRETGDKRPDIIVKKEIYENNFKEKYNILVAFEDRNRVCIMYRDLGICVFQVAEGDY